jgi:hypothetical protein
MVDVTRMPERAFGYVPTPALVAPIEFTLKRADYEALGGYLERITPLAEVLAGARLERRAWDEANPWPVAPSEALEQDA